MTYEIEPLAEKKSVASRIWSGLLTLVMVVLVAVALVAVVGPRLIGAQPLTVLSGSMEPTFSAGDLIIVRPFNVDNVQVGDIVTFQPVSGDPTLITHRVMEVTHDAVNLTQVNRLVTQGDANNAADSPIVPDQVMGKMLYRVPYLGFLHEGPTFIYIGYVIGGGLVTYAIYCLVKDPLENRKLKKLAAATIQGDEQ